MKNHIDGRLTMSVGLVLCMALTMGMSVMADEADVVRAVKMDPEKLAGINLPVGEPYMDPEDVLDGDPR